MPPNATLETTNMREVEVHSSTSTVHKLERIGMHPGMAIGYLGLLLFMIGDGVEGGDGLWRGACVELRGAAGAVAARLALGGLRGGRLL